MEPLIIPPKPACCELCERPVSQLTKHHLIPRTMHRHKRCKKRFKKSFCITHILWLCEPCHKHIHRILTEKEMAFHYHEKEALAQRPEIAHFIEWIRTKPAEFYPKT